MTTAYRITGLFIVALAALVAALAIAAKPADAAGPSIDCEVPNHIECEISHPDGIKQVTVTMMTGFGPVDVVDESYINCPTSVTVSWDPIVPNASFEVEPCDGFKFAPPTRDDGGRAVREVSKFAIEEPKSEIMVGFILAIAPAGEPRIDDLATEEVTLADFYCGKNHVPCDDTFSDFCAKIAKGTEIELPSGHGACITPGGVNPDGAP